MYDKEVLEDKKEWQTPLIDVLSVSVGTKSGLTADTETNDDGPSLNG